MRQLWIEIKTHRRSAVAFLLYYVGVWTYTWLTWSRGMSNVAFLLHFVAPIIAGAFVGWASAGAHSGKQPRGELV